MNTSWAMIVGGAPGSSEALALAKALSESRQSIRSAVSTGSLGNSLRAYLEYQWLALAQQEQALANSAQEDRSFLIQKSLAQRALLQRMMAEIYSTPIPTPNGADALAAGESSR